MYISGDYNFNYNLLTPYIFNTKSIKNEDASKPIVIHFGKNQSYIFKTVNINDDEKGKKSLYGKLNIEDLFKRAQCLAYDRYININKIILVIIKFLKLLKTKYEKNKEIQKNKSQRIFNKKNMKFNYYKKANIKKQKLTNNSVSPQKNFLKVNNEIYSLSELKNYFREIKDKEEKEENEKEENKNKKEIKYSEKEFNKREILINNLNDKINGYISNQKNQYHDELKKKVEKLLYVQEGSFNNGNNKSINEMYNMLNLSNSDALLDEADDEDEENTISNKERKNIKLMQNNNEEDLKENIPDILPTYQTLFINGFINKIQKKQKNK